MFSPPCMIIENSHTYYFPDSGRPGNDPFPPIPTSPLPCEFGLQIDQQGFCSNFGGAQQCPRGFVCLFGPADEPGPCCLSKLQKTVVVVVFRCHCFCICVVIFRYCCFVVVVVSFRWRCFCCCSVGFLKIVFYIKNK